jgi:guanylate kinase
MDNTVSKNNKRFVILSGPACAGKGPLQAALKKLYPAIISARPVLCTSRPPRPGEIHGKDYYFLPKGLIGSLGKNFAVSPVRSDMQAIDLLQVKDLLKTHDVVFAEVFYTFGKTLKKHARSHDFKIISVFLLPLPLGTPDTQVIEEMQQKLTRRGTESPEKIKDRASSAPDEIRKAPEYTHRLLNPIGEDNIEEWKSFGTYHGKKGTDVVESLDDLGPNARWLVETFVKIIEGKLPPGDYQKT